MVPVATVFRVQVPCSTRAATPLWLVQTDLACTCDEWSCPARVLKCMNACWLTLSRQLLLVPVTDKHTVPFWLFAESTCHVTFMQILSRAASCRCCVCWSWHLPVPIKGQCRTSTLLVLVVKLVVADPAYDCRTILRAQSFILVWTAETW